MHGLGMKMLHTQAHGYKINKKQKTHTDLTIVSGIMSNDYNVVVFLVISHTHTGK